MMELQLTLSRAHGHLFYHKRTSSGWFTTCTGLDLQNFVHVGGDGLLGFPKSFLQNLNTSGITCTVSVSPLIVRAACPSSNDLWDQVGLLCIAES